MLDTLESKNMVIFLDVCQCGCFTKDLASKGRIIITGCTDREICWQEDAYQHGVFSYYLIKAFDDLELVDVNNDNMVSVEEIFYRVSQEVEVEFRQHPPPSPQNPQMIDYYEGELIIYDVLRN